MRCAEIQVNLAAFVVGGLEPKEAAEVEDHLTSCLGCRNEFEELEKVNRALQVASTRHPLPTSRSCLPAPRRAGREAP
jgi:anti-sigma factor RsiW